MLEASVAYRRGTLDLEIDAAFGSGITGVFGPSGSGKTTFLNLVSGLLRPDRGRITVAGESLFDSESRIDIPAHRRGIGYVFQDSLLFPHLNVKSNLLYGFRTGFVKLDDCVSLLKLEPLLTRSVRNLSGGEKQRVAIGRALLSSPSLLLMDEPLANLDAPHKREILPYIERLSAQFGIPLIYVTHAAEELARIASNVAVIKSGRLSAYGPPAKTLHTIDAHDRFGRISILTAKRGRYDPHYDITELVSPAGSISIAGQAPGSDGTLRILVHATEVTLALSKPQGISARTALKGKVANIEITREPVAFADVALRGGERLTAAITRKALDDLRLKTGDAVYCLLKSVSIDERWFPAP
ncbi:MAG: molybdenum ABC transporter ATP-binding protein [Rhizobiales bacterium]|nr:molybdenum ABC transporter ATP-binding protein [Hyphomicrobiales bacterium]